MTTITQTLVEFDEKTNAENYKVGKFHRLEDAGESLLCTEWYPESPYEFDADKVKSYLSLVLNRQLDDVKNMAEKTIREHRYDGAPNAINILITNLESLRV